jgi:hypothetical protein
LASWIESCCRSSSPCPLESVRHGTLLDSFGQKHTTTASVLNRILLLSRF